MRKLVLSLLLFSLASTAHANASGYVCTFQGRIQKDFYGNDLPATIMTIVIRGEVAEVVETRFSAGSERSYEETDTYDVYSNDEVGLILTKVRSGHRDDEVNSTFLSVYTIIVGRATKRITYGYIYDGLDETKNIVGSCIEN